MAFSGSRLQEQIHTLNRNIQRQVSREGTQQFFADSDPRTNIGQMLEELPWANALGAAEVENSKPHARVRITVSVRKELCNFCGHCTVGELFGRRICNRHMSEKLPQRFRVVGACGGLQFEPHTRPINPAVDHFQHCHPCFRGIRVLLPGHKVHDFVAMFFCTLHAKQLPQVERLQIFT